MPVLQIDKPSQTSVGHSVFTEDGMNAKGRYSENIRRLIAFYCPALTVY